MAENNFQLRVRKRGYNFAPRPASPESNFQLRVRKDFLDRLRQSPQIRSSAEQNFQLRVRRKPNSAEQNFQLRVRRSAADHPSFQARQVRNLHQNLLQKIRERRLFGDGGAQSFDDNFQLRVRRAPEVT